MTTTDGQQLDLRFDHSTFGEEEVAKRADADRSSAGVVFISSFRRPVHTAQRASDDDRSIVQRALESVRLFK